MMGGPVPKGGGTTGGAPFGGWWLSTAAVACLALGATHVPLSAQTEVEYLTSETTRAMGLPFSDAVRVGDMLYLSGQIGNVPGEMEVVPGGIQAETRQTLENIKRVLESNGSSMERVVKCLVMMADIAEWPDMNEIYVTYFQDPYPARSALAGTGLALGARVEIECWATVGGDRESGEGR
jgi:reactive intermediate/imine deaminase